MNHCKTVIFIFLIMAQGPLSWAQLHRALTPKEIKGLTRNITLNPENLKSRLFLADHYYLKEDWSQLINVLQPISERLPDSYLKKLSQAFLTKGNYREARALVMTVLAHKRKSANTYLLAVEIDSHIATQAKQRPEGEEAKKRLFETLKQAKAQHPQNYEIYHTWINMLERHVKHYADEALRVLEDIKKNDLEFKPKHYSMKCRYSFEAGFGKNTQEACEEAIEKDPSNPENKIHLGRALVGVGQKEAGHRMLASLGEKFNQSPKALLASAQSFHEEKNFSQAFIHYQKATQHEKALAESFLGLALVAFELRKYGIALKAFTEHCSRTDHLHQEFRRASGLLAGNGKWQSQYRKNMLDCRKTRKK